MDSENKGIYFSELSLQNIRCFGDNAILKLSNDEGNWSRWNVILGDNGTGKSTILQCLAGMELQLVPDITNEDVTLDLKKRKSGTELSPKVFLSNKIFFYNTKYNETSEFRSKSFVTNETLRVLAKAKLFDTKNLISTEVGFGNYNSLWRINWRLPATVKSFDALYILGYGANRSMSSNKLSDSNSENSETLFDDDAKLINAEEWLYQMDYSAAFAENRNTNSKEQAKYRRDLAFKLIVEILPDIDEVVIAEDAASPSVPSIKFKTPYGWVKIQELSHGYKTMVAWIVDVAARMFEHYPASENPLEEPVIILVDEIDLHLHPKWQRQIFNFLENRFPKAQFIVTAHSPLIVQSAPKEANIIVLRKEKFGNEFIVKIDNDIESVRNWRIDQIMSSDIFGLNTSRNPEIEKQMTERKHLLQRNNLNEEEKKRLNELNEISDSLPTANNSEDIEAMDIIRKAADFLKKSTETDND